MERSLRATMGATERLEKLDGVALSEELGQLRGMGKLTKKEDKTRLTWLEAADVRALPRVSRAR